MEGCPQQQQLIIQHQKNKVANTTYDGFVLEATLSGKQLSTLDWHLFTQSRSLDNVGIHLRQQIICLLIFILGIHRRHGYGHLLLQLVRMLNLISSIRCHH